MNTDDLYAKQLEGLRLLMYVETDARARAVWQACIDRTEFAALITSNWHRNAGDES